jgi:hypothetical protein
VASLAAPGSKPAYRSHNYRSLGKLEDPKKIQALQALLNQVSIEISTKAHTNRAPFTRSVLFVPAHGGEITLHPYSVILSEFTHGSIVDDKLAQAAHIHDKFQGAEDAMHDTVRELERKMGLMKLQMQSNTSRHAASLAASGAPAADGAHAEDIKCCVPARTGASLGQGRPFTVYTS